MKKILAKSRLTESFSEKTFKVSGVSEAFNKGISMKDAMFHGGWRSLETPRVSCHQNKLERIKISMYAMSICRNISI